MSAFWKAAVRPGNSVLSVWLSGASTTTPTAGSPAGLPAPAWGGWSLPEQATRPPMHRAAMQVRAQAGLSRDTGWAKGRTGEEASVSEPVAAGRSAFRRNGMGDGESELKALWGPYVYAR